MNNEQLREKLYSRINAEFAQFERELLEASPQDILDKSYEYISKKNIVTEIEYGRNLSNEQLKAMLKLKAPLEVLYEEWIDTDCSESQMIRDVIYDFSKEEAELAMAEGFTPVHLGNSRLRTETAALTAAAAVYFRYME
jgi:hypothetical protein